MLRNVALVAIGVLLGWAAYYVAFPSPGSAQQEAVRPATGDPQTSVELARRMAALEQAIRELNESMALLAESRGLAAPVAPVEAALVERPAEQTPGPTRVPVPVQPDPGMFDWTKLVDASLATVLVENGLTPFDKGVNRILPDAARQVREVSAEWKRTKQEAEQCYLVMPRESVDWDRARKELEEFEGVRNARIAEIAEAFRSQVRELAGR